MAWPEIDAQTSHQVYLLLALFLSLYALLSELIHNRIHLSEPPLATLVGIAFGPRGLTILDPFKWGWQDNITMELTRIIVGVQVFAVGIDLPAGYMKRHWRGLAVLIGPNMILGWLVSALIVYWVVDTTFTSALIVAACLTPTDPVLSASVLGEAAFSQRIPKRIRHLLAAESGCNDGSAFPFLYAGLFAATASSVGEGVKEWFLDLLIWQCIVGVMVGIALGYSANRALRFSEARGFTQEPTLFVFYFLQALLCVGVGSTLGLDDFLVCFSAGTAFSWDGWFATKTHRMKLPSIIDLLLNSAMFVYFGSIIPWQDYNGNLSAGALIACAALILILRRFPFIASLKWAVPELKTWNEVLFAGHFGPMGVGAIFLAMEARARLETGTSEVLPHPPSEDVSNGEAIGKIWPIVSFVVLCSIMVHGFSALVMSIYGHFSRPEKERAPLLGGEQDRLYGMANEDGEFTGSEVEQDSDATM
jgi:sodium/hydrogen antiporter